MQVTIILLFTLIFSASILILRNSTSSKRILYLNSITTIVVLFIIGLGFYKRDESYIDIAIIYLLCSFVATFAYLEYFISQKNRE